MTVILCELPAHGFVKVLEHLNSFSTLKAFFGHLIPHLSGWLLHSSKGFEFQIDILIGTHKEMLIKG